MISFSFFKLYAPYFFRMHHDWKNNPSRVAIDNTVRLTGRNHWPVKRETPEEWKAMKSKTKRCWQKEDSQGVENT